MNGSQQGSGLRTAALVVALAALASAAVTAFLIDFSHSRNDCIRSEFGELPFSRFCDPALRRTMLAVVLGGSFAAGVLSLAARRGRGRSSAVMVGLAVVVLLAVWTAAVVVTGSAPAST